MALDVSGLLTQGSFDFGGASRLAEDKHFLAFQGALTLVISLLRDWFDTPQAAWEALNTKHPERLSSKFFRPELTFPDGVDIRREEMLAKLARDIYFGTEEFNFRIVLWSEIVAITVDGCTDPIVFSFVVRRKGK